MFGSADSERGVLTQIRHFGFLARSTCAIPAASRSERRSFVFLLLNGILPRLNSAGMGPLSTTLALVIGERWRRRGQETRRSSRPAFLSLQRFGPGEGSRTWYVQPRHKTDKRAGPRMSTQRTTSFSRYLHSINKGSSPISRIGMRQAQNTFLDNQHFDLSAESGKFNRRASIPGQGALGRFSLLRTGCAVY